MKDNLIDEKLYIGTKNGEMKLLSFKEMVQEIEERGLQELFNDYCIKKDGQAVKYSHADLFMRMRSFLIKHFQ